ncbi:DUF4345 domain-containing protein [Phenylobacterium montanum]|uniref:DUF4345 domain-containing protein n=1 Tax=Phenylobacterium montanum TaxID=2823693 RepID=A0A975ITB6_9CAUL|nr:DUF4345 domain-containing protein [Caulobacter sp. S6]QUD86687.1 DUF4345 domain-containing protein [Caulobacter sp. S6]
MTHHRPLETKLLQLAVAVCGGAPVAAGLAGALFGPAMLDQAGGAGLDSHYRYLSGLLLAIGLAYWSTIPRIELAGSRFTLLTLIVVCGGFFRALGLLAAGPLDPWMVAALVMELIITPLLYLWQGRVARRARLASVAPWVAAATASNTENMPH